MNEGKTGPTVIDTSFNNLENLKQFKVQTRNIKCLGCYISADRLYKELYKNNCLPLIKDLKQVIKK